jgi:polyisoprenoid-binding protein YceI
VGGELAVEDATRAVELDAELGGVVQDPFGTHRVGFSATAAVNAATSA